MRLAAATGLAGCSIEDATTDPAAPIYDFQLAVERVAAAVEAAQGIEGGFVLTARAENLIRGRIDLDDLMLEKGYTPTKSYSRTKLANVLFALELDRRLGEAGCKSVCIACHPGYSNTNLQSTGPTRLLGFIYKFTNPLLAQSSKAGAIPTVLAAAGAEAKRGAYYGPQKMSEARGRVSDALVADHALDRGTWVGLWEASEALLGEPFRLPA